MTDQTVLPIRREQGRAARRRSSGDSLIRDPRWLCSTVPANGRVPPGYAGSRECFQGDETTEASDISGLPYWCPACRRAFSVRIGTILERSRVPLRKWAWAIYIYVTNLKGVSSMKLHRDLKVTQTAWFMLHRLRDSWGERDLNQYLLQGQR